MLITADWVCPISSPPIKAGAVLVDDDRIVAVGYAPDLASHPLAGEHHDFAGCIITPGLVNAHTHLTLTALGGIMPSLPFAEWLPRLVAALRPWEIADHEASGVVGAEECLRAGVTAVADIAYGAAEVEKASAAGLGGVFYWELLGMAADDVESAMTRLRYPAVPDAYGWRVVCGLSPHSPYTAGPELLRAVWTEAEELAVPTAIHVAESQAEIDLLKDGSGPLAGTASRAARGFAPPGTSTVRYLDELGVLKRTTAVHLCHLDTADLPLLAAHVRGAVVCPRSNLYLDNPVPRVAHLLEAGVHVGIGTDSLASNTDLDLMAEVRTLADLQPDLEPRQLLSLATCGAAEAIGVSGRVGGLSPGLAADLSVFGISEGADPEYALVEQAGRATVRAVLSGGAWRVLDGVLLASDASAHEQAADARERSVRALMQTGAP